MRSLLKYQFSPAVWGIGACVCLLLSRWFGDSSSGAVQAVNALLVIAVLFICIHFVRGTAQLYDKHVWELPALITLICMPIFNLAVTALQLVYPNAALLRSHLFAVPLIFFSLPAFFCYYFIYVTRRLSKYKSLVLSTSVLCAAGAVYILFRLGDKVLFPMLLQKGCAVPDGLLRAAAASSPLSAFIYGLSVICFVILLLVFQSERRIEEKEKMPE